jgi:two-component system chemotaxis sensor kinase CheA
MTDRELEFQRLLMSTFQAELEEHLSTFNKGFLALERDPEAQERSTLLAEVFRSAHSLKGAARAVGLKDIETVSHKLEDLLSVYRDNALKPVSAEINVFLELVDLIRDAMAAHLKGEPISEVRVNELLEKVNASSQAAAKASAAPSQFSETPALVPAVPTHTDKNVDLVMEEQPSIKPGEVQPLQPGTEQGDSLINNGIPQLDTEPAPENMVKLSPKPIITDETIRVSTAKLDSLMDSLGELMVARMREEQMLEQVKTVQQKTLAWQKGWRKLRPQFDHFRRQNSKTNNLEIQNLIRFLENNEQELKSISGSLNLLVGSLTNDRNHLQLVTDTLQNGIRNVRMLPIATLFDLFPRMLRDLAVERQKEVFLSIRGADTEVDRQALEVIKDPLMHLLRNALDHGIEPPEQRAALGKPRQGLIQLSAEQRGHNLVLTVADDGQGIDIKVLKQTAIERGLITPVEASRLSDFEALNLIFRPGFSTAKQVSDISGRGIGMDVVRANLEQLRGLIQVSALPGKGTTFTMTFPITLATNHVLLVQAAGETLAIPMMNVERILRIGIDKIGSLDGKPAIFAEGHPLPLISLAHLLRLPEADKPLAPEAKIPVIVLRVVEKRIALRVDSFISTQEVVIKNLGRQLQRVKNVVGATILGDGQLVIILNVADLLKSIEDVPLPSISPIITVNQTKKRSVLVVDDSITTRMLEKHILSNAGYKTITAADGQEALETIKTEAPDLVVSDVNMPNLDGFGLTEAIKANPNSAHLPVILVTSLESPQDKIRGLEAGADAYIVKKSFDQRELLEMIERLIG